MTLGLAFLLLSGGALWFTREMRLRSDPGTSPAQSSSAHDGVMLAPTNEPEHASTSREEAGAQSEELTTPTTSAEKPFLVFHGIARDALNGQPIQGARALYTRSQRNVVPTELTPEEILCESISDGLGRFQLSLATRQRLGCAHLLAKGYGPATFFFFTPRAPERAEIMDLLPAAELEVHVTDSSGAPLEWVTVELARAAVRLGRETFGLGAPRPLVRSAHTDAAGVARFDALCAETMLAWTVREPAGAVQREGHVAVAPGERRGLDVVLGGAARVFGRVSDEEGEPLAELDLHLAPQSNGMHHGVSLRALTATSDATGVFEFVGVPFDTYRIGFESQTLVADLEPLVVDRPWIERDLNLTRGVFLSGRIVLDFEPDWLVLRVRTLDGAPLLEVRLEEHTFRVGPLPPGEVLVSADAGAVSTQTQVVRTASGASDVELVAVSRSDVSFRFLGVDRVESLDVDLFDLTGGTDEFWGFGSSQLLPPGSYSLSARAADGRVGVVPRFTVTADEPEEVVLELRPGAHLTLVHRAHEGLRRVRLLLAGEPVPFSQWYPPVDELVAGASATVLVPPGEWTAELVEDGRVVDTETVPVVSGERRRIVLEPR